MQGVSDQEKVDFYWNNPGRFFGDVLGVNPWDKQIDVAESVRDYERTIVPAAFGCGKTFIAACIALLFLNCRIPSKVITTAATYRQMKEILWTEIRQLHRRSKVSLGGDMLFTKLEIEEDWYAIGFSTKDNDIDIFTGFHQEHVLVIFDQASGIDRSIWEAAEGLMTTGFCRWLAIGNTTNRGEFFNNCKPGSGWNRIHISAYDIPNVKEKRNRYPGLIAYDWPARKALQWGEDSVMFRIFVLAQFPETDSDNLISMSLVDHMLEDELGNGLQPQVGCDPAEFGKDPETVYARLGGRIVRIWEYPKSDPMQTIGHCIIAAQYLESICKIPAKQIPILPDSTGIGSAVAPGLKEKGYISYRIMVGAKSSNPKYINLRTEYAFNVLNILKRQEMCLAQDIPANLKEDLQKEMIEPGFSVDSNGVYHLEKKDNIKKRLHRSPNHFDALCLAFAPIPKGTNVEYASVTQRKRFSKKKGIFG